MLKNSLSIVKLISFEKKEENDNMWQFTSRISKKKKTMLCYQFLVNGKSICLLAVFLSLITNEQND